METLSLVEFVETLKGWNGKSVVVHDTHGLRQTLTVIYADIDVNLNGKPLVLADCVNISQWPVQDNQLLGVLRGVSQLPNGFCLRVDAQEVSVDLLVSTRLVRGNYVEFVKGDTD